MDGEFIHVVLEIWAGLTEGVLAGGTAAKIASFLIPALPASYGIYVKWRNSGYRLVDRLEEFLESQDKHIEDSRNKLAALVATPSPVRPLDKPAINARSLNRTIRKLNWGYGRAASNELRGVTHVIEQQARLAKQQNEQHQKRHALAQLLLGARCASRNASNANERNAARAEALAHFEKALEIDPNDALAIEYSGMMLLELSNPAGALDYFDKLVELRKEDGGDQLARAHRLQATAYECLPQPMYGNANSALISAVKAISPDSTIERALTHEQHAAVRMKLETFGVANGSLQSALKIYLSLRNTAEGREGLDRVNAAINELNRKQYGANHVDGGATNADTLAAMPETRSPWSFGKPTKATGLQNQADKPHHSP